jgi:hypothetical protein
MRELDTGTAKDHPRPIVRLGHPSMSNELEELRDVKDELIEERDVEVVE